MKLSHSFIPYLLVASLTFWNPQRKDQTPLEVQFEITNFGFPVDGTFDAVSVNYSFDSTTPEQTKFDVKIEAASIHTGIRARDKHLQKEKYFDVEQFPLLTFQSKRMEVINSVYRLTGDLTIKGHTEEFTLQIDKLTENENNYLFTEFQLNRSTFGVGKKSFVLGDEVRIKLKLLL